ncbi:hypothetical protein BH11ACT3_BH11ACT3_19340 [soil metagenome]
MGTNKRYADHFDHLTERRVKMRGEPQSLSDAELERDKQPITRTPIALPVWAWVRYSDGSIKVEAETVAWTPRAVAVRWEAPGGETHRAWVWASAVERRS